MQTFEAADTNEQWSQDDPIFRCEKRRDFSGYPLIANISLEKPRKYATSLEILRSVAISELFSTQSTYSGYSLLRQSFRLHEVRKTLSFMAGLCFPLHLVLGLLLLVHALQSNAVPTNPGTHKSIVLVNSSNAAIVPHCYTPDSHDTPGIRPVNLKACKDALHVLVRQPNFADRYRFSRNPRAQAKMIPLGWQLGTVADCRIVVNCINDKDSAIFRYADIAQVARQIIDECVDQPDPYERVPLFKWGGVNRLKDENTFYVAVARPIQAVLGSDEANGTMTTGWEMDDEGVDIL